MPKQTLRYTVEPHDLAGHRLKIRLQIPAVASATQIVSMPAWIPGSYLIRDFSRHVQTIRGRHGGRWHEPVKLDDHRWRFDRCQGSLTVEIVVYAWDLSVRGAHVDDTHAFFNGTSVFLRPHGLESLPCEVTIVRPQGKRDWRSYTSMPRSPARLAANELSRHIAPDYDALIDHPFEIGTPQVIRFRAANAAHLMVFTGAVPNLDLKRIAHDVQRVCQSQIELFDPENKQAPFLDSANEYVFMTMVTAKGYGGLEHRASTALMTSRADLPTVHQPQAPEGYVNFLGLVSHEYFHTWHVKRIKPAAFVPYDLLKANHTRLLWIFEGFTSYYDDLMLLRSGVINLATYLKQVSKTVTSVHAGPGRHLQSLANSSFDAWTKYYKQDENAPNAISSYYAKGALVALGLDLVIRQRSNQRYSLDDVMRHLWQTLGAHFYRGTQKGLAETAFVREVKAVTGVDVGSEISQWVHQTKDVPLAQLFGPEGFTLTWSSQQATPQIGATLRPQGEFLSIAQVISDKAAHRAGLSAGDLLLACNGLRIGNDAKAFQQLLAAYRPGDSITLHTFRADVLQTRTLVLTAPESLSGEIKPIQLERSEPS